MEICALDKPVALKNRLKNLKAYQWLIFVSANAVNFAVQANSGKIQPFKQAKIAAVGKATAKALENQGLPAHLVPESGFNSDALLATAALQQVQNQRILIVRGVGGLDTLAIELEKRGAQVDYLEVYQRKMPVSAERTARVLDFLKQNQLDIITVTSGEALHNLIALLEVEKSLLLSIPLLVISERIKQLAQACGFKKIVVSSRPDDEAILNTIIRLTNGEDSGRRTI